ncbi:hypothetical protein [uncultured Thomasclavelia sp.]|uniref:hypothetical protein n=1 Tax=uncultured Thomasclavelia sp. TaxID=3025759 RepID=UPI00280C2230|nr:hypothetical protein [uncultured Thomasclavelia sp.]
MDIFEYLPQLIVAYDGNDEFANLIHVKKADKNKDYICPCCGGTVKPRALDSNKEQSHYYHKTGKCTKESQLHFFCKNWLFETGSKFYIDNYLFEVDFIEIEKTWHTKFGDYKPDITVHTTSGKIIYFEMFFTNRKTGDDYFCKWDYLGNDVVEVNIKEYMCKTDKNTIPSFTYLYHNGVCYSKPYVKRDLYANTIARIKHELTRQKVLNYKARIEQLDWFWQKIRDNKSKEAILNVISSMEYEDMVSCYEIIKRKQCVLYLKNDVLEIINQKVILEVRKSLRLPYDKNVYFDLRHAKGRTYEAGIRLNIKTEHIMYDDFYLRCSKNRFNKINGYPKIVFNKNMHNLDEIFLSEEDIEDLRHKFNKTTKYKEELIDFENTLSSFEGQNYKIRMRNNFYTVLVKRDDAFEVLFENWYVDSLDIDELATKINNKISDNENKTFLEILFASDEYNSFLSDIKSYKNIDIRLDINNYTGYRQNGIHFKMYICNKCVCNEELKKDINDFMKKTNKCKSLVQNFTKSYSFILNLVNRINNCRNNFWKAQFYFDYNGDIVVEVDQRYFIPKRYLTFEKIRFEDLSLLTKQDIIKHLEIGMKKVLKNMERCGYRIMEVCD